MDIFLYHFFLIKLTRRSKTHWQKTRKKAVIGPPTRSVSSCPISRIFRCSLTGVQFLSYVAGQKGCHTYQESCGARQKDVTTEEQIKYPRNNENAALAYENKSSALYLLSHQLFSCLLGLYFSSKSINYIFSDISHMF